MQRLRYILIALFILSYRGLSAQEFDLYDFRYYKRFDTVEELLAPEGDSVIVAKFVLNRNFSTKALDYNLSAVRFSRRGIAHYDRTTYLNGVEIPFIGGSTIRTLQLYEEQSSKSTSLHIDSLNREQTSAGFAFSSRGMPYSISFSSAQKINNDWSLAASLTAQTGRDLHIEGLFGNSLDINAVASKTWNDRHSLSVALFANPSMRSSRLASTEEAFRLTGNRLYNPAWGYQNGKLRNSRIRREFLPTIFAGYDWQIDDKTRLDVAIAITAGVKKYSALEWYDTQTPAPDNYRYMPSYFVDENDIFSAVEAAWIGGDSRYTQINFDHLIVTNRINNGKAVYAIADRAKRTISTSAQIGATTICGIGSISYGLDIKISNHRNYKQMRDLLGAEYTLDLDYFLLDDDSYGNSLQNDMASPNRQVMKGDRFGYDYAINERYLAAFAAYTLSTNRLNLDIAAKVGYCDIARRGFYRKELFADNSLGRSRLIKLSPYTFRAKADYLIADNHFVEAIIASEAKACDGEDLFLQSQYNNRVIDKPTLQSEHSIELRYLFQKPNFSVSSTLFFAVSLNNTKVRHLYDDLSGEYADVVVSGSNRLRYGLEIETEYRFADHFRLFGAATAARYQYANNSLVTIYSDKSNLLIANHAESRTKGLSLGNMPQIALTAGLSYYNKGWWANLNLNYAGLRYIEPSEMMRTERVLAMAVSPEQLATLLEQERLRDAFTIDLSLSKTLYLSRLNKKIYSTSAVPRFEDKHPKSRLIFRIGVRNLLGSTNIVYNAYESSRLQRYKLAGEYIFNRQASRYLYAYPRTFYASATFAF